MIAKLMPIILALVGSGAGMGAGLYLRPPAELVEISYEDKKDAKEDSHAKADKSKEDYSAADSEYVEMSNQFVIPVVKDRNVSAMMIISLSIEVPPGQQQAVFAFEPKLRDSFLQVMFDHANMGGFAGAFTNATTLGNLRNALREVAQRDAGKDNITDVLILEIARQDY